MYQDNVNGKKDCLGNKLKAVLFISCLSIRKTKSSDIVRVAWIVPTYFPREKLYMVGWMYVSAIWRVCHVFQMRSALQDARGFANCKTVWLFALAFVSSY